MADFSVLSDKSQPLADNKLKSGADGLSGFKAPVFDRELALKAGRAALSRSLSIVSKRSASKSRQAARYDANRQMEIEIEEQLERFDRSKHQDELKKEIELQLEGLDPVEMGRAYDTIDKEFTLDLQTEIVHMAANAVCSVDDVSQLGEAIRADILRLIETHPELADEGYSSIFAEMYREAFEGAVALRFENDTLENQAAELLALKSKKPDIIKKAETFRGRKGIEGYDLEEKFLKTFSKTQRSYYSLLRAAEQAALKRGRGVFVSRTRLERLANDELRGLQKDRRYRVLLSNRKIRKHAVAAYCEAASSAPGGRKAGYKGLGSYLYGLVEAGFASSVNYCKSSLSKGLIGLIIGLFYALRAVLRRVLCRIRGQDPC